KTPDRFKQANHNTRNQGCKKGGDHRFFYLPLEHAESKEQQARSVALFEALADEQATDPARTTFEGFADFARRHQVIVDRFGRFPHRNAILGRASTEEEAAFLQQPGSGF
ncbi:DUF924 family protein, partial [Aeromonas caviae]